MRGRPGKRAAPGHDGERRVGHGLVYGPAEHEGIGSEARFDAAALAQAYLELHNQPETEWQPELVI